VNVHLGIGKEWNTSGKLEQILAMASRTVSWVSLKAESSIRRWGEDDEKEREL
jgi:hypothetical protein